MLSRLCLNSAPILGAMGIPRHGEMQNVDSYLLADHWCFHIYGYEATLELDGERHILHPGSASLVPAGVRMVYRYSGPSEHVYFHFKPGSDIRHLELPMVGSLGSAYDSMDRRARSAVRRSRTDPGYATVMLWALLWEFADLWISDVEDCPSAHHPLVSMAIQHIEQRLAGHISVSALCQEVGVSYGYLTRLFTRELGLPVSDYIRTRRADQAAHLLTSSSMPIKAIARMVGVPRLSQFNRLMHDAKGKGPRALRLHAGTNLRPELDAKRPFETPGISNAREGILDQPIARLEGNLNAL